MEIGAVLPQRDLGTDVAALRDYAQGVEGLGYDFLVSSDHVVGAEAEAHPSLERVFPIDSLVHEPLTLFSFLAGVAPRLGFLTSVVILPQRQTALVAKQVAELDLLCGGRFRFGVGIGWNPVEFDALGLPFHNRARRFEEQVTLMRRLWTERSVTAESRYHSWQAVGINPQPVQRPVPIWIGASAAAAVRRATRIADGYLPLRPLEGGWEATVDKVHVWLREAGRDPAGFGIEGRLDAGEGTPEDWRGAIEMWRRLGASHLSVGTAGSGGPDGPDGPDGHLARLREVQALLRS